MMLAGVKKLLRPGIVSRGSRGVTPPRADQHAERTAL